MKYYCNPLNVNYRYQFNVQAAGGQMGPLQINREAADPTLLYYKGKYYIFASMTLGVWVSDDMANWKNYRLPDNLPFYDYAPDVRVVNDWVIFSASSRTHNCDFYRTKDIINGPYEKIESDLQYWDPDTFQDDDGRVYFYENCSNNTPVRGYEADPETMKMLTDWVPLFEGNWKENGYEVPGEEHSQIPVEGEALEAKINGYLASMGMTREQAQEKMGPMFGMLEGFMSGAPYIEGAYMTKHDGKYYLQYAFAGTQYNIYGDGVYMCETPLGPVKLAENNPFSYMPGGFMPGAGHGSTIEDGNGNWWHAATQRISVNHNFERRVGVWPVGFDADGEMFCNQRFGQWPIAVDENSKMDPWKKPEWYLLSAGKAATASTEEAGKEASKVTEENCQTWWRAATAEPGQWVQVDMGKPYDVRAIQINLADDKIDMESPKPLQMDMTGGRYIEENDYPTRWTLEGSLDGVNYFMIEDKSEVNTDLTHELIVREDGLQVRYLKLTVIKTVYDQPACVSGIRVFGFGDGEAPKAPAFTAERTGDCSMKVAVTSDASDAVGYNILWGHAADKLYHCYEIIGRTEQEVKALIKGQDCYVRVDAFNENGITEGTVTKL